MKWVVGSEKVRRSLASVTLMRQRSERPFGGGPVMPSIGQQKSRGGHPTQDSESPETAAACAKRDGVAI